MRRLLRSAPGGKRGLMASQSSCQDDGRQRAQLFGDSSHGGASIDRVKIPGCARDLAHTHSLDELVTVIEGTWYLGEGTKL